jgi:Na+(H+)/acetate symporter ActP
MKYLKAQYTIGFLVIIVIIAIIITLVKSKETFANAYFYDDLKKVPNAYKGFACKAKKCKVVNDNIGVLQRPSYKGYDTFYE